MKTEKLLGNFAYSADFVRIVDQDLINFDPWIILFGDELKERHSGLQSRYPNRSLIPFARRLDNDDVACFDGAMSDEVHIIHDFAKAGWEESEMFNSFWAWFRKAIEDMIEYEP